MPSLDHVALLALTRALFGLPTLRNSVSTSPQLPSITWRLTMKAKSMWDLNAYIPHMFHQKQSPKNDTRYSCILNRRQRREMQWISYVDRPTGASTWQSPSQDPSVKGESQIEIRKGSGRTTLTKRKQDCPFFYFFCDRFEEGSVTATGLKPCFVRRVDYTHSVASDPTPSTSLEC